MTRPCANRVAKPLESNPQCNIRSWHCVPRFGALSQKCLGANHNATFIPGIARRDLGPLSQKCLGAIHNATFLASLKFAADSKANIHSFFQHGDIGFADRPLTALEFIYYVAMKRAR